MENYFKWKQNKWLQEISINKKENNKCSKMVCRICLEKISIQQMVKHSIYCLELTQQKKEMECLKRRIYNFGLKINEKHRSLVLKKKLTRFIYSFFYDLNFLNFIPDFK